VWYQHWVSKFGNSWLHLLTLWYWILGRSQQDKVNWTISDQNSNLKCENPTCCSRCKNVDDDDILLNDGSAIFYFCQTPTKDNKLALFSLRHIDNDNDNPTKKGYLQATHPSITPYLIIFVILPLPPLCFIFLWPYSQQFRASWFKYSFQNVSLIVIVLFVYFQVTNIISEKGR
jgi:hypothetical protein